MLTSTPMGQAAAPQAVAGDIAIVGINTDAPDKFAFVLLTNITSGTEFKFTDNGWLSAGGFRSGEGTVTWTAPSNLCAGTVIDPGLGTMDLSASGDQILAYQGLVASPTLIYALNDEGAGVWQANAADSNTSALPTGLVNGTTAVALNEVDNYVYSGITSGTKAALLAAISNNANWTSNDTVPQTMPAGPFTVTDAAPCGGDTAPSVSSTVPTSGATGVAVSANIDVNFSESVTLDANWFTINCTVSLGHTAVVSGSGSSRTLDPDSDFTAGENCTVTVDKDFVHDDDGTDPPDIMAADYSWSFDIATPPAGAGNIAIIGINTDAPDGFAFVLLTNITSGTQYKFTDNGWLSTGSFRSGEGTLTWTAPSDLCAGTIVNPGLGTMDLSASGDQILAYQGLDASPSHIYALNDEGAGVWQATAADSNTSALPTGLVNGTTAVALNEVDNYVYSGITSGTKAALLAAISNNANWTSNDTTPQTFPAGPFTVTDATPCGSDTAPSVSSTIPTNGATGVAISANIDVNFSESVTLDANWFTINCTVSNGHTAVVSGSGSSRTLNPDTNFTAGETCTVTIDKDFVHDDDINDPPDIMAADHSWSFDIAAPVSCNASTTFIHTIQGSGTASGMDGSAVVIKGVVVGDFQGTPGLSGFFVQEEDGDVDGNTLTSEGIFVFAPSAADVAMGDVVQVSGTVDEFFELTELTSVTQVLICNNGQSVTAATLTLPFPSASPPYLERFEGMAVSLPQTLIVTEVYRLGRGGLVDVSFGQRLNQPTQVVEPGPAANTLQASNDLNRIIIDDGTRTQNPEPIIYPAPGLSASNTLRAGYTTTGVVGVLTYSNHGWTETPANDAYRVHPTTMPVFVAANSRPAAPDAINGSIRVASFNVLNYFNGNGAGGGFPTARGADTLAEFNRQRAKIIEAIVGLDADVIGLMELENDYGSGAQSAIQDLVNGINAEIGGGTYSYVIPSSIPLGGDEIAVGLLYDTATVSLVGGSATTNTGAFSARNRQPLAQTFAAGGHSFTVVVNHFKSKGSDCNTPLAPFPADPDTGDGQGNCQITREMAAQALLTWLATNPTGSADPDVLIIGDLNSNAKEDPIDILEAANYVNLAVEEHGADGDFSYVFDGQWGSLDHAMASASMTGQVAGVTTWHINAEEPISLDYNVENKSVAQQASLYSADEYRSSDHNPVIVGLQLGAASDFSDLDRSYGVAWHIENNTVWLGADRDQESTFALDSDNASDNGVDIPAGGWNDGPDGGSLDITVSGSGNGCLYAWVDWNNDGVFNRSTAAGNLEYAIRAETGGSGIHTFDVPAGTFNGVGGTRTFAVRVRLYQNCSSGPTGIGSGGESEDYEFSFSPTAVTLQGMQLGNGSQALGLTLLLVLSLAAGAILLARQRRLAGN